MGSEGLGVRCVVLVGFMGSGKTTVGETLARRLGWGWCDTDQLVEAEAGTSVAAFFRSKGEAAFRALERSVTAAALTEDRVVIATGGGWAAQADTIEALPDDTLSIWLRVTLETVLERIGSDAQARPLFSTDEEGEGATRLLAERRSRYALADVVIDVDGLTVQAVVDGIEEHLRSKQ